MIANPPGRLAGLKMEPTLIVKKAPAWNARLDHVKLAQRLSPSALYFLEFIFVNKLSEGK